MMWRIFAWTLGLFVFIGVWQLVTFAFSIPDYLIPPPSKIFESFISNGGVIASNGIVTGVEILVGFIIANLLSAMIAITVAFFPKLESAAVSGSVVLKTLPIIAIAPLLVLWFGPGIWSKVAAVVVVCFFPSLVNILSGIKSLDSTIHDLVRLYTPTRLQIVRYFILPGVRPYLYSALKVSSSLAVVGALVGEFISANSGLGFMIISGYYSLDIALVFAVLVVTSVMGLVMYGLISYFERRSSYVINQITRGKEESYT